MKIYVLKHPIKGYVMGNSRRKNFTNDLNKARKFNRQSEATNCKNTSYYVNLKDCQVMVVNIEKYLVEFID